ncbi:snurportin-1 isoform X1 [Parasteatoda tepidariorum]|uniref:snurportin-1 isoform X1 n=2 Tax=Parasteatoda tepidariorum TaxID=114398 RepID=UPI001C718CB0|nr:snurportin-1 isoform X2 [Parasteatoda tepidariorum]
MQCSDGMNYIRLFIVRSNMEDLIEAFAVSQVTTDPNSTAAEHPRFALYKAKNRLSSQDERRRKFLEAQKQKRYDYASHARKLATDEWGEEEETEDKENDGMECEEISIKPPRYYKDQLMLSEWLVDVPDDMAALWYLVLCPVGKRSLVVASRGKTKVYTRSGYRVNTFYSLLPGGNWRIEGSGRAYTILDCIFDESNKTYYILDVMCWKSHPCYDSDTEFRFYWRNTKIEETPEVKTISDDNQYKFIPLPHYDCDTETLKKTLQDPLPFPSKLDGLLFYHRKTHYISATTPLVGWLKAYMVPEMLNIEVPSSLCEDKPSGYVSMQQHIPKAFEVAAERKKDEEKQMMFEET